MRRRLLHPGINRGEAGFTLLEICIVLLIIGILLGVMMPALHSAFIENGVRGEAWQLSLRVRNAMLKSGEEEQNYVLDLTANSVNLHVAGKEKADVDGTYLLDHSDRLLVPDPKKVGAWIPLPETTWVFQPGQLCPATRVRLARGNAWLEMTFNALTGNIENEAAYFP